MRTIISRQGWEARPPKKPFTQLKKWRVQGIVVHHSGVKEAPKGIAALKAFERFHMDSRGWNAIAYNWLVSRYLGTRMLPMYMKSVAIFCPSEVPR